MSNHERVLRELAESPGQNSANLITGADPGALSVTVLFTTVAATLEAVREAARLALELGARIRILVPSAVPYPLDLERPRVDPLFRLRQFRTLCDEHAVETFIDVRLCRDKRRCIQAALAPHSLVLIGAEASIWPWTSEKLLTKELRDNGHEVILVSSKSKRSAGVPALRLVQRLTLGVKRDDLGDVKAFHPRFNLRRVSHKQQ